MNNNQEAINIVLKANALGTINNQRAAVEIEKIQSQSVNDQLKLVRERIAATSPLNKKFSEELKAQEFKLQKELTEIQEQGFQKRLSDLQQDLEERLAILQGLLAKGELSETDFVHRKSETRSRLLNAQFSLICEYMSMTDNKEFLAKLRNKEANIRQGLKK